MFSDYFPFGMAMPNRNNINNSYRYAYQGQEKDPETGKEAFELRLWDSRIGRWLTTDPAGQFHSPYNGMGNNPINGIDPDGAWVKGAGFWNNLFHSDAHIYEHDYGLTPDIYNDPNFTLLDPVELTGVSRQTQDERNQRFLSMHPELTDPNVAFSISGVGFSRTDSFLEAAGSHLQFALPSAKIPGFISQGSSFFKGTKYSDKVLKQMKNADFHAFPEAVKAFESSGTVVLQKGGDGVVRKMLKIHGNYKGREGFFEFTKEANGIINHRFFNPK